VTDPLGRRAGIDAGDDVWANTLLPRFALGKLSREPVVFGEADDRWVIG